MRSIVRLFTLLLFFGMTFGGLVAQFGVSASYKISQDDFVDDDHPSGGALGNGYEIAADYWFRLKNKRIEFYPTVYYSRQANTTSGIVNSSIHPELDFVIQELGVQFKTNIYPFDFGADCDCPTWGKQGPALHKGFFIQLAPGGSLIGNSTVGENSDRKEHAFYGHASIGAGIDFGISNLITITPLVSYRYYFGTFGWSSRLELPNEPPFIEYDDDLFYGKNVNINVGLRLGIRLDKRRY